MVAALAQVPSGNTNNRGLPLAPLAGLRSRHLYAWPRPDAGIRQVAVATTCYPPGGLPRTERLLPLAGPKPAVK